nr:P2b protein [Blackberry chlorotic ringspot virus]
MMFIPILLLLLSPNVLADLIPHPEVPDENSQLPPRDLGGLGSRTPEPEIKLKDKESVRVSTDEDDRRTPQVPSEVTLEERSPPGKVVTNCIDCAVRHLPEVIFSVKVPKLNIDFEVKDFPSSRLIFANLASRIRALPFVRSLNVPNDRQRIQLRSIGEVDVHIYIQKFGWKQVLKMSDVISGFDLPKIPSIAPKVESCMGECLSH